FAHWRLFNLTEARCDYRRPRRGNGFHPARDGWSRGDPRADHGMALRRYDFWRAVSCDATAAPGVAARSRRGTGRARGDWRVLARVPGTGDWPGDDVDCH